MLRRLTYLPILLLSLLFAGPPVFSGCAGSSAPDCCPDGPNAPCRIDGIAPAASNRLNDCCAGDVGAIADAISEPVRSAYKHPKRLDSPPGVAAIASLGPLVFAATPRVIPVI